MRIKFIYGTNKLYNEGLFNLQLEKTADVLRKLHWFPREMTPEKQAQKVHTEDVGSTLIGQSNSHVASPVGIRMHLFV